ncbi:hypothetical protein GCM10023166_14860 [Paeniglutamicibacter cryotolerans]
MVADITPVTSGIEALAVCSPHSARQSDQLEFEEPDAAARRLQGPSRIRMFTGDPVSTSRDPAWAARAIGISSCAGLRPSRTDGTTIIGSSAATAPFTKMNAVNTAVMPIIRASSQLRLSPAQRISTTAPLPKPE